VLSSAQLDDNMVALDIKTGKEVWKMPIEDWRNGYGSPMLRSTMTASSTPGTPAGSLACAAGWRRSTPRPGKILWRWYALPGPGKAGADTWPAGTEDYERGGASIWNTPALDPQLGHIYFATAKLRARLRRLDAHDGKWIRLT